MSEGADRVKQWLKDRGKHKCSCNGKKVCRNCQNAEDDYYEKEAAEEAEEL